MKLVYRGLTYDLAPATSQTEAARSMHPYPLMYRGATYLVDPQAAAQQPIFLPIADLIYRGVSYSLNGWRGDKQAARVAIHPVVQAETASVHQQNVARKLQHRLQVAKAQGNAELVRLLEQEQQRLA